MVANVPENAEAQIKGPNARLLVETDSPTVSPAPSDATGAKKAPKAVTDSPTVSPAPTDAKGAKKAPKAVTDSPTVSPAPTDAKGA